MYCCERRCRGCNAKESVFLLLELNVVLNAGQLVQAGWKGEWRMPAALQSPKHSFCRWAPPSQGLLPDLFHAFDIVSRELSCCASLMSSATVHFGEILRGNGFVSRLRSRCHPLVGSARDPYRCMLAADIFVLPSRSRPRAACPVRHARRVAR